MRRRKLEGVRGWGDEDRFLKVVLGGGSYLFI